MKGTYLPDLVIFSSPANNIGAIRECTMRKVPTMGIVDSNMDPRIVTYAIPANAASVRTAELVLGTLSLAGQEGRRLRLRDEEKASLRKSRDQEWRRNLKGGKRDEEEQ
jgi:small subunit ribosomal protein S2